MGGLNLNGLPAISQLSKGDEILVCTSDGIKTLSAEVLGTVLSDTSLFDNRNMAVMNEVNVQNISTNNKVRKHFESDTSDEIYLEYHHGQINIIKDTVVTDLNTHQPVTVQATDLQGNKLYWTDDPDTCDFNNGLPWKTSEDKRVTITWETTEYPVKVYQYTTSYIKKNEISFSSTGDSVITEAFFSKGNTSKGTIVKRDNSFFFSLKESGKDECGIEISLNEDGTVSGKLIGTWDGINDWDIKDTLKKQEFKDWWYSEQDFNVYGETITLSTADKIGWRLTEDTTNHVYTEIDGENIIVYLAQNKTSGSGVYIQEQAKNILGNLLYWKQDMTYLSSVSSNHIPIYNGKYTFMTTEKTDYPVYIYQYTLTKLFETSVETFKDGVKGVNLKFTGLNGKTGEIYKDGTTFSMKYLDTSGKEFSGITLGETESKLIGTWKIGDKILNNVAIETSE